MYFLEENCEKKPGKVRTAMGKGAHAVYKGVNSKAGRITSGAVGGLGAAGAVGAIVRIKQLEKKLSKTVNPAKRKKIAKEISMLKKVAVAGGAVGAVGGGIAAGGVKAANKGITNLRNRKFIKAGKQLVAAQPSSVSMGGNYTAADGASTQNMTLPTEDDKNDQYIELKEAYMMGYYDALDEDYLDYDAIEQAYLEGYYDQLSEMGYYDEDYDDYDDYEDDYDEDDAYLEGYYTALEELDLV